MMKKSVSKILVVILVLSIVFTGCSTKKAENSEKANTDSAQTTSKDTITVALQGEPTTMDCQFAEDTNMFWVTWQTNETLVAYNGQTLAVEPLLATEWKTVDDTTWEFTIRDGVKFHDGSTMTVKDVVYSINRIIDKNYGSQYASDFSTILKAEAEGDNKVVIKTNGPDPILLKRLTKLPIVSETFTSSKSKDDLATVINGTGPYKLASYKSGDSIELTKSDGYWGTAPEIKNVTFRFIQEASTRVSALKSNEIDIATNMLPEYVKELPQVITGEGPENYFIRLNAKSGVLANAKLRLACNYAVDKAAIAKDLFLGYASAENAQIGAEGTTGYTSSIKEYAFDPDKAKQLIKEAGYKGEKIELISEKSRWIKDGEVTETVASMLQEVGLNVTVKFVSWNEWLDTLFDKSKTPDMMFSSTSDDMKDADRILSSGVQTEGTQSAMSNAEYDKLINQARVEMDATKRQQIYDSINEKLYNDPPKLYLVRVNELDGAAKYVKWKLRRDCRNFIKEISFNK